MSKMRTATAGSLNRVTVMIRRNAMVVALLSTFTVMGVRAEGDSTKDGWQSRWELGMDLERNDNIFRLSSRQVERMKRHDAADRTSGRFLDMESVSDEIISPGLRVELTTKNGVFGRTLSISGDLEISHYIQNTSRDHVTLKLGVNQKVSKRGRLRLRAEYTPSYFVKNYLLDVTDSTGNVSRDERIYARGMSSRWMGELEYRHEFRTGLVNGTGAVLLGYSEKIFDRWFPGRNERGFRGEATVDIRLTKWWTAGAGVGYEPVRSPVAEEVLILSEFEYRTDFNNDRDFADERAILPVDRSHSARTLALWAALEPIKRLDLSIGLERVTKSYTSNQRLDPSHWDRHDARTSITVGFEYRLTSDLRLKGRYKRTTQQTNRPEELDYLGEITDFTINAVQCGVSWRFHR